MQIMQPKKTIYFTAWLVCIIAAIFYCYEYLLRIEPSVVSSALMQQFNITAAGFGIITALYYYAYSPMQMVVGIIIDRFGTKAIIGLATLACVIGSFLFSISHSIYVAGFARFLIGFGSSFAFIGALKLAAEWLPRNQFAFFVGLTTAFGMISGMVGSNGLTSLVHAIGWKNTQHLGTIVGVVLIPIIFLWVRDTPGWKNSPINKPKTLKQTIFGFKQICKNPQMWICGIVGCMLYLSLSAFAELWGISFLQSAYAITDKQAAFSCSMVFIGWLVGGPFSGWLSDHIKRRKALLVWGGILSAVTFAIVILNPLKLVSGISLSVLLFLFGVFSSVEILCFAISKESNHSDVTATAVAFTNLLVMIGGMIFQPLLGLLLDFFWSGQMQNGVRIYTAADYQHVFLIIPVFMLLGSVFAFNLKETLND